jgi:hypothetical protein
MSELACMMLNPNSWPEQESDELKDHCLPWLHLLHSSTEGIQHNLEAVVPPLDYVLCLTSFPIVDPEVAGCKHQRSPSL